MWKAILGVPDQNGVSQAWYIVEMYRSGRKPLICKSQVIRQQCLHQAVDG